MRLAAAILVLHLAGGFASADARPHLLLAIADNWSWPHAAALGDRAARTPAFDRLVREGVLFTHAFCPVPSCSPTRAAILTGRAAHQLEDAASLWSAFPSKFRVFTEALREAGYEVGFSGKGWSPGNFKDFGWADNPVGKSYASFDDFLDHRDPAKPFFFWLGNTDTALHRWKHNLADAAWLDPQRIRVPPLFPDVPAVRDDLRGYYAGVARLDQQVGEALDRLGRDGLLDRTVVMYTSDNGWQMPRGLANCYDAGTRVPLAVRWGSMLPAGRGCEAFVSLTDLAPTLLELAGVPAWPEMTGRSFVDCLLGRPGDAARDCVFVERERHANVRRGDLSYPIRGIRTRDFLYLRNLRPERWPAGDPEVYWAVGPYGDVDGSQLKQYLLANAARPELANCFQLCFGKRPAEELYDLRVDPQQLANVAARPEYAEAKRVLGQRLDRWMRDTSDPRVDPAYDAWDKYPYFGAKTALARPSP